MMLVPNFMPRKSGMIVILLVKTVKHQYQNAIHVRMVRGEDKKQ